MWLLFSSYGVLVDRWYVQLAVIWNWYFPVGVSFFLSIPFS